MAAFTWTYTAVKLNKTEGSRKWNVFTLNSTSGTYVAGGIALSAGNMGLPYGQIDTVDILDQGADGYVYTWNKGTGVIQMFQGVTTSTVGTSKLIELTSSVSPTVALTIEVKGY